MIWIDSQATVPERYRGAIVAIGNFDGVHQGHARLIGRLRERADRLGVPALAVTFDPHPVALLRPESAPVPLTWTERTAELLLEAGATAVGVFRTGPWLLGLTAREFFDQMIVGRFDARGLVEGPTFGFGRDRAGTIETLSQWCAERGISFEVVEPMELRGQLVSSSRIRAALGRGGVDEAALLLGRPHRARGRVVRGAGRGAKLGFPTANLDRIDTQVPSDGVYAARAWLEPDHGPVPAAVHIGPNVTFGESKRSVEAHLIGFQGDLYGTELQLDFLNRLRPSQRFDSVPALLEQIRLDIDHAKEIADD